MPTLWLVSEDAALRDTLAVHLGGLGELCVGPPEGTSFRDAGAADLIVIGIAAAPGAEHDALERILGFLRRGASEGRGASGRRAASSRRAPAPVLYVEAERGRPSATLVGSLIDDRPFASLPRPLEPAQLRAAVEAQLERLEARVSLRERARREWVTERVELLYAGLDLPELRFAIDPRNAARPVLLCGEPGTQRGLLARYIHNLAEPARDELLALAAPDLSAGSVEAQLLERSAGRRATAVVERIDELPATLAGEIARLLADSGALGVEPLRWLASARSLSALSGPLRELPWLRVELPPLRERPDFDDLVHGLFARLVERAGRDAARAGIDDDALQALRHYLWPGNLRELEAVLDASLHAARAERLTRADLRFAYATPPRASELAIAPVFGEPQKPMSVELTDRTLDDTGTGPESNLEPDDPFDAVELLPAAHCSNNAPRTWTCAANSRPWPRATCSVPSRPCRTSSASRASANPSASPSTWRPSWWRSSTGASGRSGSATW